MNNRGDLIREGVVVDRRRLRPMKLRMVRVSHFISTPRLRMQMIRQAQDCPKCYKPILAVGYRCQRPVRCSRLTLVHRRRREPGTFVIADTASSVMSPGFPHTLIMVGLECTGGKTRDWSIPASSRKLRPISLKLSHWLLDHCRSLPDHFGIQDASKM